MESGNHDRDRDILRRLADDVAEIAALSAQREHAALWRRLNDLEPAKPPIWINEIPWHEMNVNGELTLQCVDPFCREHEETLRRTLYLWRHMPVDMVVEPVHYVPLVIHDTGFGIDEEVDIARTDAASAIVSRHFHIQIQEEADLVKIETPVVTHDVEATARNVARLADIFGDILPVEPRGAPGFWFAPWDELIRWWGVQEAMMDLALRPELVHAAMDRLVNAYLARLDQYEEQGLLSRNDGNVRIGSGGLGYTRALPQPDFDPAHVRTQDLWGAGTAQIFSDVSPAMHWEFALQYERRWLDRWGLTYYGCCEPLHLKIDMLRERVPNLRKISMSPWVDPAIAADRLGTDYVYSHKPSPSLFAEDVWQPERARQELIDVLDQTQDCIVEVILKDLSTVRYEPQRLWDWAEIAAEVTAEYA
jgi:hypothetical protein